MDRSTPIRFLNVKRVIIVSLTLAILAIAPSKSIAQSITVFDFVSGGGFGSETGLSADGTTAVGYNNSSINGPCEAFRWTQAGGVVSLGFAAGFTASNFATAVNGDGTAVVGYGGGSSTQAQGFEWTSAGGMTGLGFASGDVANGVNGDGSVVVGGRSSSTTSFSQAFRWTAANRQARLGVLPGDNSSSADGVNTDGTVVVGVSNGSGSLTKQAFPWTSATRLVGLGGLPGAVSSSANGVSGDGAVVGGSSETPGSVQAFLWTAAGGIARATNTNGSVVVGTSYGASGLGLFGSAAFRWTAAAGMQNIETLLRNAGVLPQAFYLLFANAVSSDGTTAQGVLQGWVAYLPLPTTSSNLSVTPNAQLKFYGPVGGSFYSDAYGASAAIFTLKKTGTASLDYSISAPSWLSVSSSSGTLVVGPSVSVAVMPGVEAVAAAADNLASTVAITNTTNGAGNTSVAASLRIFSGVGNTGELGPNDTSVPVLGAPLPQFPYPSP